MGEKSFVSMEQHQCPVCLVKFDTGSILLERRFKHDRSGLMETLERNTLTGHSPCPDCKTKLAEDYVALIVIDPAKSGKPYENGTLGPDKAHRTGDNVWLRRRVAVDMFGEGLERVPMAYIDQDIFDKLKALSEGESDDL